MTKTDTKIILIAFFALVISISLLLLISGKRVLIWETKIDPGETYELPEWGNLGEAGQSQLVCRYFTGRSIKVGVYWYSPDGLMGKDQCPFLETNNKL